MKDYCTLRPLVVRVQARMYIFWKFDIFGSDDDDDDNTETPDPGQPPLPGTKYPVRVSPHFDKCLFLEACSGGLFLKFSLPYEWHWGNKFRLS